MTKRSFREKKTGSRGIKGNGSALPTFPFSFLAPQLLEIAAKAKPSEKETIKTEWIGGGDGRRHSITRTSWAGNDLFYCCGFCCCSCSSCSNPLPGGSVSSTYNRNRGNWLPNLSLLEQCEVALLPSSPPYLEGIEIGSSSSSSSC